MPRSDARAEFLGDIITGAVEGGTGYWAQVSQYQWVDSNGAVRVHTGERVGDEPRAVLHRLKDDESGYEEGDLVLTLDVVAKGIGLVLSGEASVSGRIQAAIKMASRENDAGQLDSIDADVIAQAGLLGEVIYG